ncbi:S53 family peptidase [Burkholderia contaminans]|uniref:S53 family peptidase n=1 Tax=Burkholderia contaminans TaxID=488447 RepID=UPI001CF29FB0|nr:S53 family peptidase [Burkholderia contaminans]MCA7913928.1 S53 family peptidase [Burkholderia contaminans]UUX39267.1 S53 family peptidase [Burkholderia contaminans]
MVLALAGCGGSGSPTLSTAQAYKISALQAAGNVVGSAPLAATASVHVALVLKLNNEAALDSFLRQAKTPGSTNFGAVLTSAQIAEQYAPTAAQVAAVRAYLQSNGFSNIKVAGNNMIVEADAPANVASSTFQTTLVPVMMTDGSQTHINTTGETVPDSISGVVQAVLGLDTATRLHTHNVQSFAASGVQNTNTATSTSAALVGHNPTAFPAIYPMFGAPPADNIAVGIIAEGNLTQPINDLGIFESNNHLSATPVSVINAGAPSADTNGNSEWSLDSQSIVGMSGGVKQLNFYVASSMAWSDMAAAINKAVSDNSTPVINMSIGGCESFAPTASLDQVFKLAVAQGQTFSVSTGDTGSVAYGCSGTSVEYPASSPYVVAVGGTSLYTNADGTYDSQTAWSGSGGGASTVERIPSWQSSVPLLNQQAYRGLPDVAFDADPNSGAQIIVGGQVQTWGGTSLAAPLFSAVWARRLQSQAPASGGFAAPVLYSSATTDPLQFLDITSGSNGAYTAGTGWDFVTGLGSYVWSGAVSVATASDPVHGPTIVVLRSDGTVLAKTGFQSNWVYEAGGAKAIAVASDSVNGPTLAVLQSTGNVIAKTGLQANWVNEIGGATAIAVASDPTNGPTLAVLESGGAVVAKTGGISTSWVNEIGGATAIAVASDQTNGPTLAVLESGGGVVAKTGGLATAWVNETQYATAIAVASDSTNGPTLAVLNSAGGVIAKTGGLTAAWVNETQYATAIAVASDPANGPTLAVLNSAGGVIAKTGGISTAWINETGYAAAIAVASDGSSGQTLVVANTQGGVIGKTGGLSSSWQSL